MRVQYELDIKKGSLTEREGIDSGRRCAEGIPQVGSGRGPAGTGHMRGYAYAHCHSQDTGRKIDQGYGREIVDLIV